MQTTRLANGLLSSLTLVALSAAAPLALASPPPAPTASAAQKHDVKASPFDGLRWSRDEPEVDVEGTWYKPISIDGVTVQSILEFCDGRWRGQRQKRFGEDLIEALVLMGHTPGTTAKLVLQKVDDGAEVTLDAVKMTHDKRQAIRRASSGSSGRRAPRPAPPATVSNNVAADDIEAFGEGLKAQFAYLELKGIDLDAALDEITDALTSEVSVADLATDLDALMKRFGDGHARVAASSGVDPGLHLPCLFDIAGGGVVAFEPGRRGFVDAKRPYVQAIDGTPIDEWVNRMAPRVVDGSPQLVQHRALRAMRELALVRMDLGLEGEDDVKLTLSSKPKGGHKKTVKLDLKRRRPTYGPWPRTETRLLEGESAGGAEGGIGVIRLPQMDDDLIPSLRAAMHEFKDTAGLVIDVRGNGGGRRGLCAALAGYLVSEDADPVVGNCAAYRLAPGFDKDHLGGSRLLYRADDRHWSKPQRNAIATFAKTFQPEWKLPAGFSEWHYLVLDRTGHEDEFFYDRPVIVLVDEACFSATDIFAAALGALPNVTLMGTSTGGGSARTQSFRLPGTGIQVRCASMASFQPIGELYDGNGVAVDVEVRRAPTDLLMNGSDTQLEAAIRMLTKK